MKAAIPSFKKVMPDDVDVQLAFDQSGYVSNAINGLVREALVGAMLTGVVVLLFLRDWRSALIVVANISFALAGAVVLLWLTGQTCCLEEHHGTTEQLDHSCTRTGKGRELFGVTDRSSDSRACSVPANRY